MYRRARQITAVIIGCAALYSAEGAAALTYYFNWHCTCCLTLGSGSNGREGPFRSPSVCESARASMGASLNQRGCGPNCYYPQLCLSEGTVDAPPVVRPSPVLPPPSTQAFPAPSYVVSGRRRAHEAQWERQESERAAQVRDGKATPPAPSGDLAPRWRNAVSWYEVRGSAQALEIVLVETCAMADCSRKTFPNRPVFRGRVEGDWLLGVVLIRAAIESRQDETPCPSLAGEFPVKGRISGDHRWISWKPAEFPTRLGCSASTLSLGTWRREP